MAGEDFKALPLAVEMLCEVLMASAWKKLCQFKQATEESVPTELLDIAFSKTLQSTIPTWEENTCLGLANAIRRETPNVVEIYRSAAICVAARTFSSICDPSAPVTLHVKRLSYFLHDFFKQLSINDDVVSMAFFTSVPAKRRCVKACALLSLGRCISIDIESTTEIDHDSREYTGKRGSIDYTGKRDSEEPYKQIVKQHRTDGKDEQVHKRFKHAEPEELKSQSTSTSLTTTAQKIAPQTTTTTTTKTTIAEKPKQLETYKDADSAFGRETEELLKRRTSPETEDDEAELPIFKQDERPDVDVEMKDDQVATKKDPDSASAPSSMSLSAPSSLTVPDALDSSSTGFVSVM